MNYEPFIVPILVALLITWLIVRVRSQGKKLHDTLIADDVAKNAVSLKPIADQLTALKDQEVQDEKAREDALHEYSSSLPPISE